MQNAQQPTVASDIILMLHHIGVVTNNLEGSMGFYSTLGYSSSRVYLDPVQKARIVLMHHIRREPIIELVFPEDRESPAAKWVQRIQAGPYHICYEAADLQSAVDFLRRQHHFPVLGPVPALAFDMRRVVFLWSPSTGLLELLESSKTSNTAISTNP
jgi:methylmalonyl-CoA/ethylmalonyl-CoA epimerase